MKGKRKWCTAIFLGLWELLCLYKEGVNGVICLAHNHDFLVCAINDRALD